MRRTIDTPAVRTAKDNLAAARKELEQQEKALRHLDAEAAELADAVTEAKAKALAGRDTPEPPTAELEAKEAALKEQRLDVQAHIRAVELLEDRVREIEAQAIRERQAELRAEYQKRLPGFVEALQAAQEATDALHEVGAQFESAGMQRPKIGGQTARVALEYRGDVLHTVHDVNKTLADQGYFLPAGAVTRRSRGTLSVCVESKNGGPAWIKARNYDESTHQLYDPDADRAIG